MATAVTPAPVPPVPTPVPAPTTPAGYQSVSLYVGDLHGDVTEANLFEVFSQCGTVQSIRVCRDIITRRSLGYAYVNYTQQADAERAMDTLNGSEIKARPCRIMWSQRDPSLRKSGKGNIFIKNLDKKIDIKALHDTFSQFGNILSCKIELDSKGDSKGYGYIQFAEQENAVLAIDKVNGMMLLDKPVFVGQFVPRRERIQANSNKEFTNVFIKNLDEKVDDEKLKVLFEQFGVVKSVAVMRDDGPDGKSKGFGFVNFDDPNDAAAAVNELNNTEISGKLVYVGRAMKKSERESELRHKFEQLKLEQMTKYHNVNLYVKNIDDEIDSDDKLRNIFAPYGTITSAKIMKDARNNSKGFGFVCFATPEDATKAVTELNGKMIAKKPLYVAMHERKELRRSKLEQHFAQRSKMPARMPVFGNGSPMFYQAPPSGYGYPQPMMPRGRFQQPGFQPIPANYVMMPGGRGARGGAFVNPAVRGAPAGLRGRGGVQQVQAMKPQPQLTAPQPAAPSSVVPLGPLVPEALQAPTAGGASTGAVTAASLDSLSGDERKRVLGEQLYPLIVQQQPQLAGKITGMILESANTGELIELLESPNALHAKVAEALEVLQVHQTFTKHE